MKTHRRLLGCLLLAALVTGCGSRAQPMPPLRPQAPPFPNVEIAQLGADVVLQFDPLPSTASVSGEEVVLDRIEVLLLGELYPVITPEHLAAALPEERRLRVREAREGAGLVADRLERDREARAAAQATEEELERMAAEAAEEAAASDEDEETELLTEEEILLRRLPREALSAWRAAVVPPQAILETARRFDSAVDALWNELRLPRAIIDRSEPPELPDPLVILEAANAVASRLRYETGRDLANFLELAAEARVIPYDDLDTYLVGNKVVLTQPIGVGATEGDQVRTRYWFAVRARSTRNHPGVIQSLESLAPMTVPAAPGAVTVTLTERSARLTWEAPVIDQDGAPVPAERLRYNVYRRVVPAQPAGTRPVSAAAGEASERSRERADRSARPEVPAATLLTPLPIAQNTFDDRTVTLGRTYLYEVRAALAPAPEAAARPSTTVAPTGRPAAVAAVAIPGPRKEGPGTVSSPVVADDVYPPLKVSALTAVRAGNRVSLRWTASTSTDVAGYRVYRHQMPAPELPAHRLAPTPAAVRQAAAAAATGAAAADAQDEAAPEQAAEGGRRRNELVLAGWELLTTPRTSEVTYSDPASDPTVAWTYLVEAVDGAGNVSTLERVVVPAPDPQ